MQEFHRNWISYRWRQEHQWKTIVRLIRVIERTLLLDWIQWIMIQVIKSYKANVFFNHQVSWITRIIDLNAQTNRTLMSSHKFPVKNFFHYTSNWSKISWAFTQPLINIHRVGNKFHYVGLYIKRAHVPLFLIRDPLPTLNLPIKGYRSSRSLFYLVLL